MISAYDSTSMASASHDTVTETERLARSQSWLKALENSWLKETLGQTRNFSAVKGMELHHGGSENAAKSESSVKVLPNEIAVSQNELPSSHRNHLMKPLVKWYDVYPETQGTSEAKTFFSNHPIAENLYGESGGESTKDLAATTLAEFGFRTFLDNSKWAARKITLLSPDKNSLEVWMRDNEIDKYELDEFISDMRSEFEVGKQRSLNVFLNGKRIYSTQKISSESEG